MRNIHSKILIIICLLIGQNAFNQDIKIAVESNDKSENKRMLNSELKKYFATELADAINFIGELQNKEYKKVEKRLENNFAHKNWTNENIKEKVDWSAKLITKYGIPISDSIILSASHPISWIIQNSKDAFGHRISFEFVYPDKIKDGFSNSISIIYEKKDDLTTGVQKKGYDFFMIMFNKAESHRELSNLILDFPSMNFAHTLDSALKVNPKEVEKLDLGIKDFELFKNNYINRFPNLFELRIEFLNIDSIPEFVRKMTKLKVLKANNNNLNSLPTWISELSNLEELKVGYNKIKTVPKGLRELKNFKILELQWNSLPKEEVEKIKEWFKYIKLSIGQQE